MANEQVTQNGVPLGNLANFSISDGLNSPYPTDGTGTVPNANISVVSDNPYELVFAADKPTNLSGTYSTGYTEFFKGSLATVSVSEASGMVALTVDGDAARLNQDIHTLPIIPDPAYGGNNKIVRNTLAHWLAECGIFRYQHPGEMMLQVNNISYGIGYYNHKSRRLVANHDASNLRTTWTPTETGADTGIPFGVGTKLHIGMVTEPYSSPDKIVGDIFFTSGVSSDIVEGDPTNNASPAGFYLNYTRSTQKVDVYEFQTGKTSQSLFSLSVPSDTTSVRMDLQAFRVSATRVDYTLKLITSGGGNTGLQNATYSRTGTYLPTALSPLKINHTAGNNLDYKGVDTIYISATDQFITDDRYADLGYSPQVTLQLTIPSGARPLVPGMSGNAWQMVNELCTLYGLTFDAQLFEVRLPSTADLAQSSGFNRAEVRIDAQAREKAETVEVVNYSYRYSKTPTSFIEFWRAEDTYSVDRGERQEHIIQVEGGSFLTFQQPKVMLPRSVPVTKPGKATYSYYSVYGSDNSPVTPDEWESTGGFISVEPTDAIGEFKLVIQAPTETMTKAPPYIISLESSMPSLVIGGVGMVAEKETLTSYTGAGRVPKKLGATYDSPMVCGDWLAWNVANAMSTLFGTTATSAGGSLISPGLVEDSLPVKPSLFRKQGAIYRIDSRTYSRGVTTIDSANRFTTCADVNKEYSGLTCSQQNALFTGKSVQYNNLAPLKRYID